MLGLKEILSSLSDRVRRSAGMIGIVPPSQYLSDAAAGIDQNENQIRRSLRAAVMIYAAVSGTMAFVGAVASAYAYFVTPEIQEVFVYVDRAKRTYSKGVYLFNSPLFQIFLFLPLFYYACRWDKVERKLDEIKLLNKNGLTLSQRIDFPLLYRAVFTIFCLGQAVELWRTLYRVHIVLNKYGISE
jgi:hypothetical protein